MVEPSQLVSCNSVSVVLTGRYMEIHCQPNFDPRDFDQAIDLMGVRGRTDYLISYDQLTGGEVYYLVLEEGC